MQIARRGNASIAGLARSFRVNDHNKNGKFEFDELELVTSRAGVFLKMQELKQIFRYFDKDKSGTIDYNEFLMGLTPKLKGRRARICEIAFKKFDKNGNGVIEVDDLKGVFDASIHPKVKTGQMTEGQVLKLFLGNFEGAGGQKGDGKVSFAEFMNHMTELSSNMPFDDEAFVRVMENSWKIKEDTSVVDGVDQKQKDAVKKAIKEKVRQRTKAARFDRNTLYRALRRFDIDRSGTIVYQEFDHALQTIGIHVDDHVGEALFNEFDLSGNGIITYKEFAEAIYDGDDPDFNESMLAKVCDGKNAPKFGPTKPVVVFVLGSSATGKGTHCQNLVVDYDFEHLSTGDLIRAERKRKVSDYGEVIESVIQKGKPIPPNIVVNLIKNAIAKGFERGHKYFLLHGFPSDMDSFHEWGRVVGRSAELATTISFTCEQKVITDRLLALAKASGQADATAESITAYLKAYHASTAPVLKVVKSLDKLDEVDSSGTVEQVYELVKSVASRVLKQY